MKTAKEWAENLLVPPAAIELTTPLFLQVQVDALRHAAQFARGSDAAYHIAAYRILEEAARIERGEAPHVFNEVK